MVPTLGRNYLPTFVGAAIRIREVGPRDGLQAEKKIIPTDLKVQLVKRLLNCGLSELEIASFVSPKAVPQMADGDAVCESLEALGETRPDRKFSALVPNERGLDRFREHSILSEAGFFIGATDEFNQRNVRASTAEQLKRFAPISEGLTCKIRAYLSVALGCPFSGTVSHESVVGLVKSLYQMGAHEITIGDTTGVGTPGKVKALFEKLQRQVPIECLGFHGHDTYGTALANCWAAYEVGVRTFDASIAGLGGCPYAPGATGNLATENLVYLFEKEGVPTGIDLNQLHATVDWVQESFYPEGERIVGGAVHHASKPS